MVKFNKQDFKNWEYFRNVKKDTLSDAEYKMICQLHSIYYKHKYFRPCTCSPKTIKSWIKELNIIWDNGVEEN
tara:strand:+ start:175 stop:393 length:219 start_codon:yes stop_codon:yes gene_type:complete